MDMGAYQTRYVALEVAYLGARYHGLASQTNTEDTVEVRMVLWQPMCRRLLTCLVIALRLDKCQTSVFNSCTQAMGLSYAGAGSAVPGAAHQQAHTGGRGLAGHPLLPLRAHRQGRQRLGSGAATT